MADRDVPYPPTPPNVPPDLTTPTASYRVRVVLVLTTLFLFVVAYLGLVVGSAYLCYWSFASLGPAGPQLSRLTQLQEFSRSEERVIRTYNDAIEQRQQGTIDDGRLLEVLERDVLPPWRAERQRLGQLTGESSREQRIIDQYGECLQLQEEGWELMCRAIRYQDASAAEQARRKSQKSEELSRKVSAEASRYFSRLASRNSEPNGWYAIVGIVSGLLCLFLVKGIFKWRRGDAEQRCQVSETEQPDLFAFIRQLCRDTRAPLPHRVYLTPDVNAAVFYHESLLSMLLPTRKNLVIGLGLVNQLNLSEFKAVLAHEFGHFSQNSMRLGNYVYMANRVIAELVFGRDWLDKVVGVLQGVDIRIAVFDWAFTGVLWVLRKTLQGLFRVINFANSALARQMEFNADLVAVSVTGSDALVHALARLDFASECLSQAWNDLNAAADKQLYTRDLFYHQTRAAEYQRALRKDPRLGEPPALPEEPRQVQRVFQREDTSVPKMWARHPSNHDREVNAKRRYIRSQLDQRSPWILFRDALAVRKELTRRVYQAAQRPEGLTLEDPEVVQAFIDEEHAETTYHPRYHGLYDHRYVMPGNPAELLRDVPPEFSEADRLAEAHARLYGDEVQGRMQAHWARQQDFARLAPLAHGAVELTGKDFQFRGKRYRARDAGRLLEQVKNELDKDLEWMARQDRQTFLVHYEMARQVGKQPQREMEDRYRFHLAVQELHGRLSAHQRQVQQMLRHLAGRSEWTQEEFHGAVGVLGHAHTALSQSLEAATALRLPPLKNTTPGEPLEPLLINQPLIPLPSQTLERLNGTWIGRFMEQLGEVLDRAQRIHFKSLGGILALQEQIADQWSARRRDPVQATGVEGLIHDGTIPR